MREHGASFDRLIREATIALCGDDTPADWGFGPGFGPGSQKRPPAGPHHADRSAVKNWSLAGRKSDGGAAAQNRGTNVFSRVLCQLSYLAATPDPTGSRVLGANLARARRGGGCGSDRKLNAA
jgi:hypothetical protein